MKHMLGRASAALVLLAVGAAGSAQTCLPNIPATAPDSRFTDNGNGTVTDAAIGLMWKQCAEGLSGAGCASGSAVLLTWQQALQRGTDAEFAGFSDWRLPNKNELASLVEQRCFDPAIDLGLFPSTPSTWFWSSSPNAYNPDGAWGADFGGGYVDLNPKYYAGPVRLVRGGQ